MVRVVQGGPHVVGMLEVAGPDGAQVVPVLCARKLFGIHYPARTTDGTVLVMADPARAGVPLYAFRVDDVISVVDVDERHIQPAPQGLKAHSRWLDAMVRLCTSGDDASEVLAQLLDPDGLATLVRPLSAAGQSSATGVVQAPEPRAAEIS
jgi:chemotaxis signal transduction protein